MPAPTGGRWVVRHYHRGGAVAPVLGDRYFRLGTPRPVRELQLGQALEKAGVPTPRHVGCAVYPAGPWYRGDLVTELVPNSRDLAAVLFGSARAQAEPGQPSSRASESEVAMRESGSLIRILHDCGVIHRDLNLKNVLIAVDDEQALQEGGMRALVLDLDRATLGPPVNERWRRRMIERFWRSARKWEKKTGEVLGPQLRAAFEGGYERTGPAAA